MLVRRSIVTLLSALLLAAGMVGSLPGLAAAQSNPIVVENQQPGTTAWQIPWGSAGNDAAGQIKGYASATSVNKGGSINFQVSVNPAQTYTIEVYRMGWYQGLGGRLMQRIGPLNGFQQPACPTDSTTGLIECQWTASFTLVTQTSWTSGIYLALLTNAQGFKNYVVFVVRDDSRTAALIYQQPVTTYQAYNNYPNDGATGKSLYGFNSRGANTVAGGPQAVKVSFDRPYLGDGTGVDFSQSFFVSEYSFVRWLERSGYDVSYSTSLDGHTNGARILNYRGFISAGHDKYWSRQMFDAVIAARDAGVNVGFFGADAIGAQVRFESSSTGVANRVMVHYRDAGLDPVADPSLETTDWRLPPVNRPEQTLRGVMYNATVPWNNGAYASYAVTNSGSWVYANTGFRDGDIVPGIVGYEADRAFTEYPGPNAVTGTYALLSQSPITGTTDYANSSIYQAPSGAWVFSTGTTRWGLALDNFEGAGLVDPRIQQTTVNLLTRFVGSSTPQPDFTLSATPSSQNVVAGNSASYTVSISATGGFTDAVTLSVSGLPSGATGTFTPNPANTSSTLSVATTSSTVAGAYTVTITGVTGSLTRTTTLTLTVTSAASPDFTLTASPASITMTPGSFPASYRITINATGGFDAPVTLSVSGLPAGARSSIGPNNPASPSSTPSPNLLVDTNFSTPAGTYTFTITGVSGNLTRTTTVTLVLTPADFTISASPASRTVAPGENTTYTVTVNRTGEFGGLVSFTLSGLPDGATTGEPVCCTNEATLIVRTATSTPAGTYTLTITARSGDLERTATVGLTVTQAGRTVVFDRATSSGFQWGVTSVTTPAFVVGSGPNRAAMIMVAMSANNATNITARLGGIVGTVVPGTDSGTTASIRTMIFQVVNPPSGSQTATVSWTNAMHAIVGLITVSGVDQTNPVTNGAFAAFNSSPTAATSVTIPSNPGDRTASIGFTTNQWQRPGPTSQTIVWEGGLPAAGDFGPGIGTTTHTWTDQYVGIAHSVSGANFRAAGP